MFLKNQTPELLNFDDVSNSDINHVTGGNESYDILSSLKESTCSDFLKGTKSKLSTATNLNSTTSPKMIELTQETLRSWIKDCKNNNLKSFKNLIFAFNDIVNDNFGGKENRKCETISKNMIKTRQGFKAKKQNTKKDILKKIVRDEYYVTKEGKVINYMISKISKIIATYLKQNLTEKQKHPHLSKKWKIYKPYIFLYLSSCIQIISMVKLSKKICPFISSLSDSYIFFHVFCDLSKQLIKNLIDLLTHEDKEIREISFESIKAFLIIHSLYYSTVFKKCVELYINYYKPNIYEDINILLTLKNNIIELAAINLQNTYKLIFQNMSSISRSLRDAISLNNKKLCKDFFSWKILASFDLWFTLISKHINDSHLKELIFPLIEITFSILRTTQSPAYFPAKLHYIRFMIKLVSKDLYIPLIPTILNV
ncbi:hypothetical protein HZS_5161 [Henneguya salminicola]|nr:hypothetical protein HZS_5161 [Henneguya salminicola]